MSDFKDQKVSPNSKNSSYQVTLSNDLLKVNLLGRREAAEDEDREEDEQLHLAVVVEDD
jgi:hypothetical protein